jgi:hypothetical protein
MTFGCARLRTNSNARAASASGSVVDGNGAIEPCKVPSCIRAPTYVALTVLLSCSTSNTVSSAASS